MYYHPKRFKFLSFKVENCPTYGKKACITCKSSISKQEIRVTFHRDWGHSLFYHLECYTPNQFIIAENIEKKLDKSSKEIFENWANRWNRHFFPLNRSPIIPYTTSTKLPYLSVPNRRPLIEIFKFLSAVEIFQISAVSKSFYQIAQEEEVWRFLISRDYLITHSEEDAKKLYVKFYNENCFECKRNLDENFARCPLLKKTICKDCSKLYKYRLICKTDIRKSFGIEPGLLKLKYWQADETETLLTYLFLAEQELKRFRCKQKEFVLKMIQVFGSDHPIVRLIDSIDLNEIDNIEHDKAGNTYYLPSYKPKYNSDIKLKIYKKVIDFIRCGKPNLSKEKIINLIRKELKF